MAKCCCNNLAIDPFSAQLENLFAGRLYIKNSKLGKKMGFLKTLNWIDYKPPAAFHCLGDLAK